MQGLFEEFPHWSARNYSQTMAKEVWTASFSSMKSGIEDLKLNLRKVFDVVGLVLKENREIIAYIWYISNQIGCQESRIEDLERDLRELMGTIDIIKEEVLKMAKMS